MRRLVVLSFTTILLVISAWMPADAALCPNQGYSSCIDHADDGQPECEQSCWESLGACGDPTYGGCGQLLQACYNRCEDRTAYKQCTCYVWYCDPMAYCGQGGID